MLSSLKMPDGLSNMVERRYMYTLTMNRQYSEQVSGDPKSVSGKSDESSIDERL